jgi:hypothetical protein
MFVRLLFSFAIFAVAAWTQAKYDGPVPEKADVPYIRHANKLIPTEVSEAKEEKKKDDSLYAVPGANSSARTPLIEPIFLVKVDKLNVQQLTLYKLESRGGRRELLLPAKPKKDSARPLRMTLDQVRTGVFKLEVQEPLFQGEYCLSPNGSNAVFCFTVF